MLWDKLSASFYLWKHECQSGKQKAPGFQSTAAAAESLLLLNPPESVATKGEKLIETIVKYQDSFSTTIMSPEPRNLLAEHAEHLLCVI